jgi:hypothetical protein
MRFDLRPTSALVLAGTVALSMIGCASESNQNFESHVPASSETPLTPPTTADETHDDAVELSEFERQLPLSGQFVSQSAETSGSVEIARCSDGSVWASFTNFSTGTSSNLRLHLNEGALVKSSEGAWTVDDRKNYEISDVVGASANTQEFEIPGSPTMSAVRSITIFEYSAPDFLSFGSAELR